MNSKKTNPSLQSFADYILQTKAHIEKRRPTASIDVIEANSPFELRPLTKEKPKRGALLIHGLLDSPAMLRDVGDYLCREGFLVRSVLLPGHGTHPDDLLAVERHAWQTTTEFGVRSLSQDVEALYLVGFSMGAALAIFAALTLSIPIAGLILLSPAIRIKNPLAALARLHRLVSRFIPQARWLKRCQESATHKYQSICFNAIQQVHALTRENAQHLAASPLKLPIFMSLSADDITVDAQSALNFFNAQPHPHSQALLYAPAPPLGLEKRVIWRNSHFPEQRILDFSHTCIPISPSNAHYGQQGRYVDLLHDSDRRGYGKTRGQATPRMQGEIHQRNLKKHRLQRLTYNPDFAPMMQWMMRFINNSHDE